MGNKLKILTISQKAIEQVEFVCFIEISRMLYPLRYTVHCQQLNI